MLDQNDQEYITQQIRESESRMMVMMESYFNPKFDALAELLKDMSNKLVPQEAMDIVEDRVDDLEKTVDLHTRQISELKKAQ